MGFIIPIVVLIYAAKARKEILSDNNPINL